MSARADSSNIKIYGFVKGDPYGHPSYMDFNEYNKYFNTELNIDMEQVTLSENIYTNFDKFVDKITAESGKKLYFIFIGDPFIMSCRRMMKRRSLVGLDRSASMFGLDPFFKADTSFERDENYSPNAIMKKLEQLQEYGTVIPNINFMYATGSKYYVMDPDFNKLMIQPTLTFPKDNGKISELPYNEYILKKGFSSSSFGNYKFTGDGNELLEAIKFINNTNMTPQPDPKLDLYPIAAQGKPEPEDVVCDDYTIVQPLSELYKNCYEFKFGVLNNEIICVTTETQVFNRNFQDKLNPYILKFVNNIIDLINQKWKNYVYARIDIIAECDPSNKDAILYSQDIEPVMYLNEIEPLASGFKAGCINIENDKLKLPTGTLGIIPIQHLYEGFRVEQQIATELAKLTQGAVGGKKYRLVKK